MQAGYYPRKYRGKVETSGWYLLTNLDSTPAAVQAFKRRSGIEAMFKDCLTGGDNFESTHASGQRLMALILIIAIAYSCAILLGRKTKRACFQKSVGTVQELKQIHRRHSAFKDWYVWLFVGGGNGRVGFFGCPVDAAQAK